VVTQQYNIYSKTATFFEKSGGFTYLGLAAALAAWYNIFLTTKDNDNPVGFTGIKDHV